jgi:hypothetical protein
MIWMVHDLVEQHLPWLMILSSNTCPCCLSEDDFDVINIDVD